jgi:DNA-binding response OmpR family regulator
MCPRTKICRVVIRYGKAYGEENMQSILIIEDDVQVALSLRQGLEEGGYTVRHADTAASAHLMFQEKVPALVLLDLGLPDADGLEVLGEFRAKMPELPILILTARDQVVDRVTGLDRGAADYILKPFALPELLARIRGHLRRTGTADTALLKVGDLQMDLLAHKVSCRGAILELAPRELELLITLIKSAGHPVSREQIAREVWNSPRRMSSLDNLIDVHISRLRERIKQEEAGVVLRTIRGVGYVLEAGGEA